MRPEPGSLPTKEAQVRHPLQNIDALLSTAVGRRQPGYCRETTAPLRLQDLSTGSRARRRSSRRASMSTAALDAWGWRIPFLLGLVVGIAGYVLRRYVLETATVEKVRALP